MISGLCGASVAALVPVSAIALVSAINPHPQPKTIIATGGIATLLGLGIAAAIILNSRQSYKT